MAQFPSPMVEHVRAHERIDAKAVAGLNFILDSVLAKPVEIFVPGSKEDQYFTHLLIHFHG